MPGPKTNEREGTRAMHRGARVSAYKVREVLDLVRNKPVADAQDILRFCERDAAFVVGKVLASAVANASHNDQQDPEELYVSACFADEGTTIKRWRPRARGRATRIRKRTCHVTVIVSRMEDEDLARLHARRQAEQAARRARRVAGARKADAGSGGRAGAAESREGGVRGLRTRVRPGRRRAAEGQDQDQDQEHDHDHDHGGRESAESERRRRRVSGSRSAEEAAETAVTDETADTAVADETADTDESTEAVDSTEAPATGAETAGAPETSEGATNAGDDTEKGE
ncbi:MAG: 50S ribosomal protein L22 [Acidimicrobiales bacterium]